VQDGNRLTVVDTDLPRSWNSLKDDLSRLGRSLKDIEAVALTYGRFGQMGFARRAQAERRVPVLAHQTERPVVLKAGGRRGRPLPPVC
jgi:hypothetical protein